MCEPTTIFAASVGIQLAGGIAMNQAYRKQGRDAMAQAEYEAAVGQDRARAEAQQIRRDGKRDRGNTLAAVAMSGAKIGEWSAGDVERQVMEDTETDAMTAILNGNRDATVTRMRGRRAQAEASDKANAALLNTATSLMSSWDQFRRARPIGG